MFPAVTSSHRREAKQSPTEPTLLRRPRITTLLLLSLIASVSVFAHPMGNFSISHYARLTFNSQTIDLLYVIDMAEIPAFQEKPMVDVNGNGTVEKSEQDSYLARKVTELTDGLVVKLNGFRCPLERLSQQLQLLPGGLNLPTLRIGVNYRLALTAAQRGSNLLEYEDRNFAGHAGWKEIVVDGEGIEESSASRIDKSQGLTLYPEDPSVRPPADLTARIRFKRAPGTGLSSQTTSSVPRPRISLQTAGAVFLGLCCGGFLLWRWLSGKGSG